MNQLTPRQTSILRYIENFFRQHQLTPTEREIGGHFRIHQNAVRKHLKALETKGRLTMRRDGRSRGIRLADAAPTASVPIVGQVTPGAPLLDPRNLQGSLMLDMSLVGSEEVFLLRVSGDPMIDAGILEDDLLLVRRTRMVRNGQIVVARYDDQTVVRRFFDIAGRIVLEPANKRHQTIVVDNPEQFELEGRVVGLIRTIDPSARKG